MTDQKWEEEELRNRERLLARAEELAHMGSWQLDLKTNTLKWSDNMYRILGFEPGEVQPNADLFWRMVSKEDRERLERLTEEASANHRTAEYEVRCILADGRFRTLLVLVAPVFSEGGELIRMIGTN